MVRKNISIFYDDGNVLMENKNENAKEIIESFLGNFLEK